MPNLGKISNGQTYGNDAQGYYILDNKNKKTYVSYDFIQQNVQKPSTQPDNNHYIKDIEKAYKDKFKRGMPGGLWDYLNKEADQTFKNNLYTAINTDTATLAGTDNNNDLANYKAWGLINDFDIADAEKAKNKATADAEAESLKYKFTMPTEWQTIEDTANNTLKAGRPEFNPQFVTDWETKLEPIRCQTYSRLDVLRVQ